MTRLQKLTRFAFYAGMGLALALAASAGNMPANADTPTPTPAVSNQTTSSPVPTPAPSIGLVFVAWSMPSWVNSTTPTWPQNLSVQFGDSSGRLTINSPQVLAEIPDLCGTQYQVDAYNETAAVLALIKGGTLTQAGQDSADLIPGGWGVAYKLVKNPTCIATPTPTPTPSVAPVAPPAAPKAPRTTATVVVPVPAAVAVPTLASTGSNTSVSQYWADWAMLTIVVGGAAVLGAIGYRRRQDRLRAAQVASAADTAWKLSPDYPFNEPDLGIIDENEAR